MGAFKFSPGAGFGCSDCYCGDEPDACSCGLESDRTSITLAWSNVLSGAGSTALAKVGSSCLFRGTGSCNDYEVDASVSPPVLTVANHVGGGCPATAFTCTSAGASPGLPISINNCASFVFQYSVSNTACAILVSRGYTSFTVSR